jgi:hypothetical protein
MSIIGGSYDPRKKAIILPILDPPRDICTALAHELIHHYQLACHTYQRVQGVQRTNLQILW